MPLHEASDDAFGFGAVSNSTKEKIKQIRPSAPPESTADIARIDAVADSAGFVSREVNQHQEYSYRSARAQRPEPRIPLNMRVPVSLGGAFQRFCEENRYSYPEALAEVMRRAGLPVR
jgi:hypothetical protein